MDKTPGSEGGYGSGPAQQKSSMPMIDHHAHAVERLVLVHTGILFGIGLLTAVVNVEYYHGTLSAEDGILEWTTVLALGSVAWVCAVRLIGGFGKYSGRQKATMLMLALLAAFGAGEEISWGQRLFDIETPEYFVRNNLQNETNLHNIAVSGVNLNKLIFSKGILLIFVLYLAVLTPAYRRFGRVRRLVDAWAVPMPKNYQVAGYIIVIVAVEVFLNMLPGEVLRRGELTEFAVPVLVALNIAYPSNAAVFETT